MGTVGSQPPVKISCFSLSPPCPPPPPSLRLFIPPTHAHANQPIRTLARRAVLAVSVGVPVGVWSALASMPSADTITVSLSAIGAAGTYACALMVLLEAALPRPAVLSKSSGGRSGGGGGARGGRAGGRAGGGGRAAAGSVLKELYVAVMAFMPVVGIAQASEGRRGGGD